MNSLEHLENNIVTPTDWHAWRFQGIGASDAAAACGASRYKSRYQLWREKTGELNPEPPTEQMRWGLWLEPAITQAYYERTGLELRGQQVCWEHLQYPWMRSTLDTIAESRLVEFKSVGYSIGHHLGEDGDSDSLPPEWILQVQHQLAVTGFEVCDVAVFLGHLLELRLYPIIRNDDLIARLIESESEFWESVQNRTLPPPETIDDFVDFAKRTGHDRKRIGLHDPQVGRAIACYQELGDHIKESEKLREIYKKEILWSLRGHEYGDLPDGRVIRAQTVEIAERIQTVKAHTQLRLTVREPKRQNHEHSD